MNICKKSCCWTPYSCARQGQCACHTGGQPVREKLTFEELVRAQAVLENKGGRR